MMNGVKVLFVLALVCKITNAAYYSYDGHNNDPNDKHAGGAFSCLDYLHRQHEITSPQPECCAIDEMINTAQVMVGMEALNQAINSFGQFSLSHDCAITPTKDTDPLVESCFSFPSSQTLDKKGRCFVNEVSSWLDLSNVYGDNEEQANALRSWEGGHLRTSALDPTLPPYEDCNPPVEMANGRGVNTNELFCAGDRRANENTLLLVWHILFFRNHGRIADFLATRHPGWDDETIFQKARHMNIAEYQHIVYYEYVHTMLGDKFWSEHGMGTGGEYDEHTKGGVFAEFSAGAFRWSHAQIAQNIGPDIPTLSQFFNPGIIHQYGVDNLVQRMLSTGAGSIGPNFANGIPFLAGFDCIRSRDMKLVDLKTFYRKFHGIELKDWSQITQDSKGLAILRMYGDTPGDNIDFFAGLMERHEPYAPTGRTMQLLLKEQIYKLRSGDWLWYEWGNTGLTEKEFYLVNQTTLRDIIERNTYVSLSDKDAFSIQDTKISEASGSSYSADDHSGEVTYLVVITSLIALGLLIAIVFAILTFTSVRESKKFI